MTTTEAIPSQKALSEKQAETYQLDAEIRNLEPVLKGAQTRRRNAEYGVESAQWVLDSLTAEETDRIPEWQDKVAKAKATLEKRLAREGEYQMKLDELVDRRSFVTGEIKELTEKVREERQALRARQAEKANAVVEAVILNHPLAKEHGLRSQVSGSSVEIGWDEEYEGRDGKTYTRGMDVTVDFPHEWFSTSVKPAEVRWSTYSSPGPDPLRYGAAIMVGAAVAKALDEAGIVDAAW